MKEKIEQLSKGIFVYRAPALILPEKIEVSVETGKTFSGSLLIRNEENTRMKGVLYSSNRWFVIEDDKFIGSAVEIHYHVNAAYLNAGEVIQGVMSVVSDCGEAAVPFTITVEEPCCMSSLGRIKDMFQFTNLARSNPAEARQMFCSADFERMLTSYDRKYLVLYRHLKASRSQSQALEEFLICLHKKLRVEFSADRQSFVFENCTEPFSEKIMLTRSGWGFGELRVSTDAAFIQLDHKIIWTDHFVGDTCALEFVVDPALLREGTNYARILLKNIWQEIEITVECHKRREAKDKAEADSRRTLAGFLAALTTAYMKFRLNELTLSKYLHESKGILEKVMSFREEEYRKPENERIMMRFEIYQIHLNMVAGRENRSRNMLSALLEKKEKLRETSPFEYCALLYLEALHQRSEEFVQSVCDEIWEIYEKEDSSWGILWFLLYLDKRYDTNKEQKLEDIRAQYQAGCRSPVLYYEAASVFHEDGELLKELGPFELQVMHFAAKRGVLSKDTAACFVSLASREKDFHPMIYQILVRIYEKYKSKDALSAICAMLIKGHMTAQKYFPWFEKGVAEQLRILELYEYYMYTLPENIEEPIASSVLTYFMHNNTLNDRKKDYLFANIIYHKEDQAGVYRSYAVQIGQHARKQLNLRALNAYLALIYDDVLKEDTLTAEDAAILPDLMFQYDLECKNPGIRQVAVVHKEDDRERISPVIAGTARIELYTEDAEIFLIDQNENRYSRTVEYTLYPLMHTADFVKRCYELDGSDRRVLLNLAEKAQDYQKFDEASVEQRMRAADAEEISRELQNEYLDTLVHYYYDNFETELLDQVLSKLDLHYLPGTERAKMIELMIVRDMYRQAADAIAEFGSDGIQVKRLIKLSWYFIREQQNISGNQVFLEVCYSIFCQGKYDESVLNYLVHNFYGTTFEMDQIWKAARAFDVDTFLLEDRLLAQMLFAETFIEESIPVFRSYYRSGCNRKLVRAALSYYAYCCLMDRQSLTQELFDIMKREVGYEENDLCVLAVLKYYSEQEMLTDSEINYIDLELTKMSEKGIRLPFFKRFGDRTRVSRSMLDLSYIQYRTGQGTKVSLSYVIVPRQDQKSEISLAEQGRHEMMEHMICGIYVSEFVLFGDEELRYEIYEGTARGPKLADEGTLRCDEPDCGGQSLYGLLNRIVEADGESSEALDRMGEYMKADYIIRKAFAPIDSGIPEGGKPEYEQ